MCGRFALSTPPEVLAALFKLNSLPETMLRRFNIAPTQNALVVRASREGSGRVADMLHWGLVPFWADDKSIGNKLINARAESAPKKPAFRAAFKQRRCLVPADGFFEWKKSGGAKQPYFIRNRSGQPMAFAGLWETWRDEDKKELESFTILTTEPNEVAKPLHNRMPMIIQPGDFDRWLDVKIQDVEDLKPLMQPAPAGPMEAFPVSRVVNSPRNDSPECVKRVEEAATVQKRQPGVQQNLEFEW